MSDKHLGILVVNIRDKGVRYTGRHDDEIRVPEQLSEDLFEHDRLAPG